MTDQMPLPASLLAKARAFTGEPAPVRPAATVALLRPSSAIGEQSKPPAGEQSKAPGEQSKLRIGEQSKGLTPGLFHVYLLRRQATMAFGGVYAFPGGGVDPDDEPRTVRTDWAARLGVPEDRARAVVGAACRELFEEAGVLLAGPVGEPDRTVGDVSGWEAERLAVQRREMTLTALLDRYGLRLRDDLLFPWARWISPEFEPKRFDTWFFVALLPDGQQARDVSGEADRVEWADPRDPGDRALLPPTWSVLRDLAACADLPAVVAASEQRDAATPVQPRAELTEDGGVVLHL